MTEPDTVEPLSPEAQAFLTRHAATGEPTEPELATTRAAVLARAGAAATVAPAMPPARRRWVAPEFLAAAAVVLLLAGVGVVRVLLRPDPVVPKPTAAGDNAQALFSRATLAKDSGNLAEARKLALRVLELRGEDIGARAIVDEAHRRAAEAYLQGFQLREADRAQALALFEEVLALTADDDEYHHKAQARAEELRLAIQLLGRDPLNTEANSLVEEAQRRSAPSDVSALFKQATAARTIGHLSQAATLARQVLERDLGHIGARVIVQQARAAAKETYLRGYQLKDSAPEEALKLFEEVLELTAADDEYHQKAEARTAWLRLELAPGAATAPVGAPAASTDDVSALFARATKARSSDNWSQAVTLARQVLEREPGHAGATEILRQARPVAKDLYLRGYQLKESGPGDALKFFKEVMVLTAPDDEYHQKAAARISELLR